MLYLEFQVVTSPLILTPVECRGLGRALRAPCNVSHTFVQNLKQECIVSAEPTVYITPHPTVHKCLADT